MLRYNVCGRNKDIYSVIIVVDSNKNIIIVSF